jgi:hypothetical protein
VPYPLKVSTRQNLKAAVQDVKYLVEFDWLKNGFIHTIDTYNKWVQFRELKYLTAWVAATAATPTTITNGAASYVDDAYIGKYVLLRKPGFDGMTRRIVGNTATTITVDSPFDITPATPGYTEFSVVEQMGVNDVDGTAVVGALSTDAWGVSYNTSNIGNGTVDAVAFIGAGQADNWTLICIGSKVKDGVQRSHFLVKGRINGVREDAYSDEIYDNGLIRFTVHNDGTFDYVEGDSIVIRPALTVKSQAVETVVVSGTDYLLAPDVEGGPDFLSWESVSWEGDKVAVYARTSHGLDEPDWSGWLAVTNGAALALDRPGRYLQFKLVFPADVTPAAPWPKIYNLRASYKVIAHTNVLDHIQYRVDFNRVQNIRMSRSKEDSLRGYSAADWNMTLDNSDRIFSRENMDSPYANLLEPNVGVRIYTTYGSGSDDDLVPRLVGVVDRFSLNASSQTVSLSGKDYTKFLIRRVLKKGDSGYRLWVNQRLSFLLKILVVDAGLPLESLDISNLVVDPIIAYAMLADKPIWTSMQDISRGVLADIFISEDGKIKVEDRYIGKNLIPAPSSLGGTCDYISIAVNDYYETIGFITRDVTGFNLLSCYINGEVLPVTNAARGLCYAPNDMPGEDLETRNLWFVTDHDASRVFGSASTLEFEPMLTLAQTQWFTNLLSYNRTYPSQVGGTGYEYMGQGAIAGIVDSGILGFYKLAGSSLEAVSELFDQADFLDNQIQYEPDPTVLGNPVTAVLFKNLRRQLQQAAESAFTTFVYVRGVTGRVPVPYDDSFDGSQFFAGIPAFDTVGALICRIPSASTGYHPGYNRPSWRFSDATRTSIVLSHHFLAVGEQYEVNYQPAASVRQVAATNVVVDPRVIRPIVNTLKVNEYVYQRIQTIFEKGGSDFRGHLFYVTSESTSYGPDTLCIRCTNATDFATSAPLPQVPLGYFPIPDTELAGEVTRLVAIEAMPDYNAVAALVESFDGTEYTYTMHWFDVDKAWGGPTPSPQFDGLQRIYGSEVLNLGDSRVRLYDAVYDPTTKLLMVMGGVADGVASYARLYKWSPSAIEVTWNNLAGHPFRKIYPRAVSDVASVTENEYYYLFQKLGGFRSVTSQIYAWTEFTTRAEDYDRCLVEQEVIALLPATGDGVNRVFQVPVGNQPFDAQYAYLGGDDVGANFKYDGEFVTFINPPADGVAVQAGTGKRLMKWQGVYMSFAQSAGAAWASLPINLNPPRPSTVRVTLNATCVQTASVTLSGMDAFNNPVSAVLDFNAPPPVGTTGIDDQGRKYRETTQVFKSFTTPQPTSWAGLNGGAGSEFQIESAITDLIPGVVLEIHTSAADVDEQFGGSGDISNYVDKVYIGVKVIGGLEPVDKVTSELRFSCGTVDKLNGVLYAGTENRGYGVRYSNNGLVPIHSFSLHYDQNLMDLSTEWGDNEIRNIVFVKSKRFEPVPYREVDIESGIDIRGAVPSPEYFAAGYNYSDWLWARLSRIWLSYAPQYLYKGRYMEYDISFEDPVLNDGQTNSIRFNAQFAEDIGLLDVNGQFRASGVAVDSDFPTHQVSPTRWLLHAGFGPDHEVETAHPTYGKIYAAIAPWDDTLYKLRAQYPSVDNAADTGPGGVLALASLFSLANGVDMSGVNPYQVNITIDGVVYNNVDLRVLAANQAKVTATEIVEAINQTVAGAVADVFVWGGGATARTLVRLTSPTDPNVVITPASAVTISGPAALAVFGMSGTRLEVSQDRGLLERRNVILYLGTEQQPLTYAAGDFTIGVDDFSGPNEYWYLELSAAARLRGVNKMLVLRYPDRINISRSDIDKRYLGTSGAVTVVTTPTGALRTYRSLDPQGRLYEVGDNGVGSGLSGFHLNMLWPNDENMYGTSYLRIENPTNEQEDSQFKVDEDPSGLAVWVNRIEVRGRPMIAQDLTMIAVRDEKSIELYDKCEESFENEYIQDSDVARRIGNFILGRKAFPLLRPSVKILAAPNLQVSDVVAVKEMNSALAGDLFEVLSVEESLSVDAAYEMSLGLEKIKDVRGGSHVGTGELYNNGVAYSNRTFGSIFSGGI